MNDFLIFNFSCLLEALSSGFLKYTSGFDTRLYLIPQTVNTQLHNLFLVIMSLYLKWLFNHLLFQHILKVYNLLVLHLTFPK
jgi:hypothetical protein